ncbi:hypothetical protein T01_10760 [Trichinella spiralis]|uniref:Uncharacterized protein n=1 Tax=Trichinella spiralis TaxID=6334 RepID=A0A0V1BG94_TRISP|nr:hypothetical protein T01_10760 [Trichinella spiralis]
MAALSLLHRISGLSGSGCPLRTVVLLLRNLLGMFGRLRAASDPIHNNRAQPFTLLHLSSCLLFISIICIRCSVVVLVVVNQSIHTHTILHPSILLKSSSNNYNILQKNIPGAKRHSCFLLQLHEESNFSFTVVVVHSATVISVGGGGGVKMETECIHYSHHCH